MMPFNASYVHQKLSSPTSIFGIKLWVDIIIFFVLALSLVLIITLLFIFSRRKKILNKSKPVLTKNFVHSPASMNKRLLSRNGRDIEMSTGTPEYSDQWSTPAIGTRANVGAVAMDIGPVSRYTFGEIVAATNGLADENVIGRGDYGVVYHGVLFDNTRVAVKKLLYKR